MVLAAGFFPWTLLLPMTLADFRKRPPADGHLFLILWIALPFIVFSLSASKLPHYILPLYPPLAILVGATVAKAFTAAPSAKMSWVLSFPAVTFFLAALLPALLFLPSDFLPKKIPPQIYAALPRTSVLLTVAVAAALMLGLAAMKKGLWHREFYILVAEPITASVSLNRSSKQLAEAAASVIQPGDQLVLYDKYLSSLPFYLRVQQPIWVVWSGNKSRVLGSDYIVKKRPEPAAGYGKVLYTYEEFADLWVVSRSRLVVFIDDHAADTLARLEGALPRKLLRIGDIALVTNR
jgi:4-amino-4-deoxy-L-arabinose transferase-like glycosyltransferase